MVCYDRTIFERVQKNLNIEKIIFKVVQMKQCNINIFMEHDLNILMIFGMKEKSIILTHTMYCYYDWFCAAGSRV